MIEDVLFYGFIWLFIAFFAAGLIEYKNYNFTQNFARTIWWPLVAPILAIKVLIMLAKWLGKVLAEQPAALGDIWRIR